MLQIMTDVPENVVGIRAAGQVTQDDYREIFVPAVERASKEFGEINLLMVFETQLSNFTPGAWLQDAKMSLKQFGKWNKIAVVSDEKIVEKVAHVFSFISPAVSKGFTIAELDQAKMWVGSPKEATA